MHARSFFCCLIWNDTSYSARRHLCACIWRARATSTVSFPRRAVAITAISRWILLNISNDNNVYHADLYRGSVNLHLTSLNRQRMREIDWARAITWVRPSGWSHVYLWKQVVMSKESEICLKGIVHFEIKIWYLSAYPKGIQDVGVFFSSVDPILMFLGQTVLVCQSYNGRYKSLSL